MYWIQTLKKKKILWNSTTKITRYRSICTGSKILAYFMYNLIALVLSTRVTQITSHGTINTAFGDRHAVFWWFCEIHMHCISFIGWILSIRHATLFIGSYFLIENLYLYCPNYWFNVLFKKFYQILCCIVNHHSKSLSIYENICLESDSKIFINFTLCNIL